MFFPNPRHQQSQHPMQVQPNRRTPHPYYNHPVQQPLNYHLAPSRTTPLQSNFPTRLQQTYINHQYPTFSQQSTQPKRPSLFRNEQGQIDLGKVGNGVSNVAGAIGQLSPIAKMIGVFFK